MIRSFVQQENDLDLPTLDNFCLFVETSQKDPSSAEMFAQLEDLEV